MNYGWRFVTLYRRQGSRPSPRKRNAKSQNGCLRRPYKITMNRRDAKGKGEKERYTHLNAECGPLEKGMANHFSILALRTP